MINGFSMCTTLPNTLDATVEGITDLHPFASYSYNYCAIIQKKYSNPSYFIYTDIIVAKLAFENGTSNSKSFSLMPFLLCRTNLKGSQLDDYDDVHFG